MNHNYVSISFPQQKMKLSDWEISQIKKAVDNQTAEIKKLITKAITAIGQSTSPPPDNAIAPLQNLQAAYLPEGWFAPAYTTNSKNYFETCRTLANLWKHRIFWMS